jgi:hypothetical protein
VTGHIPDFPPPPQLTVRLDRDTGPVFGGASGALYGLSEDGVPAADLLAPLHVRSISQKPPGGRQHPTGDADRVAATFFGAGGELIAVNMQDSYPDWPYQDTEIDDYLAIIKRSVAGLDGRFAFIPFNEPDWIWYDLKTPDPGQYIVNRDRFLADWTAACRLIRSAGGLVVGPNEAYYDARFMADFLACAKATDVLPDIVSWHELSPDSLATYRSSYAGFRALEQDLGIPPLPVAINEYGNRRDLSCPGQLVQWLAMFEDTKVYASLAYWDIADNYADNAVQNAMPNGSWWLLRWYGALTGHTVEVTAPARDTVDGLQGLAALDASKRQARVIVASPAGGAVRVVLAGLDPDVFGRRVRVLSQAAGWTGYDGVAWPPLDLAATEHDVADGQVSVDLAAMDPMSAYQLTVSPATGAPQPLITPPWTAQYLAADAALTGCGVRPQGSVDLPQEYAAAGGRDVGPMDQPGSRAVFQVAVPHDGRYLLSVYYGNQTQDIAEQVLRVDDRPAQVISYPPTLSWGFRSHRDLYVTLTAGSHAVEFGAGGRGSVTLNALRLYHAPGAVPGVTHPQTHYPAAYADLHGGAAVRYDGATGLDPAGQVTTPAGAGVRFTVQAGHDGFHALRLRYAALDTLDGFGLLAGGRYLARSAVRCSSGSTFDRVYLHAGINRIEYVPEGTGGALIDSLDVTPDAAADAARAVTYAAPAPGAGDTLTFTGVGAPWAGTYRVMVSYACNDRAGSDNYNANLIDQGFTVTTSAGTQLTAWARNTYSWHQFNTAEVTVRLAAGENTITIGSPLGPAPDIDQITVAPAVLP